ncbi:MAG: formyltetrahydrofolate deformylase [Pseudomonadales bacterium]|nr:formyltetrahydrofolate deformylase [Pseudomonadales bacterium]
MKLYSQTLIVDCPDETGLIAIITNICHGQQLNIVRNDEFVDSDHDHFFMRTELEGKFSDESLIAELTKALPTGANIRLVKPGRRRLVLMVTKEPHCLGELLLKSIYGSLNAEIVAVIGNYSTLADLTEKFGIPFHHITHKNIDRDIHEQQIKGIIDGYDPDYVVLAKYMRILTGGFVASYANKIINIHHSFLPAFVGAKPYHQAYKRGVKIIGATAHFVTDDLDEGPIISQDVIRVDHRYSAEKMAEAGRHVEESVLTHALQQLLEEKVLVYKNRTVVFE